MTLEAMTINKIERDHMSVGSLLRKARQNRNLSRAELAAETDINQNSLAKYEKAGETGGQFPPLPNLALLCLKLEVDPREVFCEALGKEHDVSAFFQSDNRKAPEASIIEISALLGEATKVMRRHGFSIDLNDDDQIDADSFVSSEAKTPVLAGEPEWYALLFAVGKKGINARAIPKLIKEARETFDALEYEELLALYQSTFSYGEIHREFIESIDDLSGEQQEAVFLEIQNLLIVRALYTDHLEALNVDGAKNAIKAINAKLGKDTFFDDEAVASKDWFFEDEDAFLIRARKQLVPFLVELAETRNAINLFDGNEYPKIDGYEERFESGSDENDLDDTSKFKNDT